MDSRWTAIINRMLQKEPEARYQTAGELLAELRRLQQGIEPHSGEPARIPPDSVAITVLPFKNLSSEKDREYFCDGITEGLLGALTSVEGLRVVAWSSAVVFRDRQDHFTQIADRLKVEMIVTGSVRWLDGFSVRIEAQLIRLSDGDVLWSGMWERDSRLMSGLEEELVREISGALKLHADGPAAVPPRGRGPGVPEAYHAYLWGRYHWNSRTLAGLQESVKFYSRAVVADPSYGEAYAALAKAYYGFADYGIVPPVNVIPKAEAAARQAIAIDDSIGSAHASLAVVHASFGHDWDRARSEFARAVELNPKDGDVRHWRGLFLACLGEFGAAIDEIRRGLELDPLSININRALGTVLFTAGDYERALEEFHSLRDIAPDFFGAYHGLGEVYIQQGRLDEASAALEKGCVLSGNIPLMLGMLGYCYGIQGRREKAQEVLRRLEAMASKHYISGMSRALVYLGGGDEAATFEWLDRAYEERSTILMWVRVDPKLDGLRNDSRFGALLGKMNLDPPLIAQSAGQSV